MFRIISYIISILHTFNKFIWKIILALSSFIDPDEIVKRNNLIHSPKYNKFSVDDPPIAIDYDSSDSLGSLNWKQIVRDNNVKPVVRTSSSVPSDISCPFCSAPSLFIYSRKAQGKGFSCKCCNNYFTDKFDKLKSISFKCPHCSQFLTKQKIRDNFILFKCKNNNCPFYIRNFNSLSKNDKLEFSINPGKFKLHYIYRAFNVSFSDINKDYLDFVSSPVSLSNIHNSSYVVALCLTYHINYGLSSRATSSILRDVHEIFISHQTVENYCKSVSNIVHPILEFYPYSLSNTFAADETYISVLGKEHYIFFFFDAIKKIITSYRVFPKRNSLSAIQSFYSTLSKCSNNNVLLVTDGNPIYNVAYLYWNSFKDYNITLKQVIGLKNLDKTSKEYRSEKQIIERLNRTLKSFYRNKGCFTSLSNANNYMVLFSVFFNFLRPHEALHYKTPVEIPELNGLPNMISKWLKLIELGYNYLNIYC